MANKVALRRIKICNSHFPMLPFPFMSLISVLLFVQSLYVKWGTTRGCQEWVDIEQWRFAHWYPRSLCPFICSCRNLEGRRICGLRNLIYLPQDIFLLEEELEKVKTLSSKCSNNNKRNSHPFYHRGEQMKIKMQSSFVVSYSDFIPVFFFSFIDSFIFKLG